MVFVASIIYSRPKGNRVAEVILQNTETNHDVWRNL